MDGSGDAAAKQFPWIKVIKNKNNLGFSAANNIGVRNSSGEYLLFANPDIEFFPEAISLMINQLKNNPDIGAVAPQILSSDGNIYPSCWTSHNLITEIWKSIKFTKYFPKSKISLLEKRKFYLKPTFVEITSGACIMIKRDVFENIGGWDEDYFLYCEDYDLCYRLNKSGWLLSYYPEAKVLHYGGKSAPESGISRARLLSGLFLFFKKHRGPVQTFLLTIVLMRKLLRYYAKYATNIALVVQGKYENRQ